MKITESIFVKHYTSLSLSDDIPNRSWRKLLIDGVQYDPVPIFDAGNDCIAIHGNIDLTGKDIEFV